MFLRRSAVGREPLAVAMSGVRLGERMLQIGMNDPRVTGALAAKPGLSGESTIVVSDDATAVAAQRAVAETGALVNIRVHSLESLPFDGGAFDVAVIHDRQGLLASLVSAQRMRVLAECRRVLRTGGRVIVIERGTPSGLAARLLPLKDAELDSGSEGTLRELEAAGFRSVRTLGDRDKCRFIEGIRLEDRT